MGEGPLWPVRMTHLCEMKSPFEKVGIDGPAMGGILEDNDMPAEVGFSNSEPNPYADRVKRCATINIDSAGEQKHLQLA